MSRALDFIPLLLDEPELFDALTEAERRSCGELLRDLYFDERRGPADEALLEGLSAVLDPSPTLVLRGLGLSCFPTRRFTTPRFFDPAAFPEAVRGHFYRPNSVCCAAFVDPLEFQYRSYENILPLDRMLGRPALSLGPAARLDPKRSVFRLALSGAAEELLALDGLGLYSAPLNRGSRGGERFIFHAAGLAAVLGEALAEKLPAEALAGFSHVNPVFRCNRFEAGDAPFREHIDTPYSDPERGQVSRLTLLLYLTGGRGAPALSLDGLDIDEVPALTAFVFDQSLPHSGAAFEEGPKVFLRSELVFEAPELGYEPGVAALFSKACYLTGESLVHPELAGAAHEAFDRAAMGHWRRLTEETAAREPWVLKEFRGAAFLANGYDFWFLKGGLGLEECAALTVLDALNCKLGGEPFRRLCRSAPLESSGELGWPAKILGQTVSGSIFAALDKPRLNPPLPRADPSHCCPTHGRRGGFDAMRCGDILELFGRARRFIAERVFAAPIVLLGEELFLDPDRFRIQRGRIVIFSDRSLPPLNFASCWQDGSSEPADYIDVDIEVEALQVLLPPILFAEVEGCYRLSFDFFHNGWTARSETLPVPKLLERDQLEAEAPWVEAAAALARRPGPGRPKRRADWWWSDSPLMRELYPELL